MRIELLQNIIDILRHKIYYLSSIVDKCEDLKEQDKIKTLVLGSSHLEVGYKASENQKEFNLATSSQDLYYSYNLYKFCNNLKSEIKNIIISFSVFTPGHSLIKTSTSNLCIIFKNTFGIDYQYPEVARRKKFFLIEPIYKHEVNVYLKKRKNGKMISKSHVKQIILDKNMITERALKHYKNHQRAISQMPYLIKILEEAKQKRQNVFIVVPPATDYYRDALPSGDELFACLYDCVQTFDNVKILNFYDSNKFDNSDFFDGDHLNANGAEKLTTMIRQEL